MNSQPIALPCILFALARESRPFLKSFPGRRRIRPAPFRAWLCERASASVLVLETGVGPQQARSALEWVLNKPHVKDRIYTPDFLLFAGFAGALSPDLQAGDLVLADAVADVDGNLWPTTWPCPSASHLDQLPLRRGTILTTPYLVSDPRDKRRLGDEHRALAVDMESATIARVCAERGMPFRILRAVSDDAYTPVSPDLAAVLAKGRVAWGRLIGALLRRPALMKEMVALSRTTQLAARNLAQALTALLSIGGE
ncbi:MAG: hypothetical protein HY040_27465 [Planctomycetes bacterium]|nr:hypothetical protein [Planctomycetota bacterium]